jgi:rod shape-determining protein MreD
MIRLINLLIGLLVVVLQITLVNLVALFNVKPDLVLIFVVARGLLDGATGGVLWGFGLGLLLDALSGGLMGLGSLAYSLAGFISGRIAADKIPGQLHFLVALALSAILAHGLFLYFGQPWKEMGLLSPLLKQYLPGVFYTLILGVIWMISPFALFHEGKRRGR